jgi:hypothetical protein
MRTLSALVCGALLAASGCGNDDSNADPPQSGPLVTYARSGGFASMPEQLVVEADGTATVEAGVSGARTTFELSAGQLDQLRAELEAADFDAVEQPPGPTACADCYSYEVVYDGTTISYDDADTPPASVTAVVALLSRITSEHYPPGALSPPAG